MPIEVYPIKSIARYNNYSRQSWIDPTPEQVAESIKEIYEKVEKRGGEIVASHTVAYPPNSEDYQSTSVLYLVAEIPELKQAKE